MKLSVYFYAFLTGIINSAIGSGGGMISVPVMKKSGLDQKNAQATTLAVILPLTLISAAIYAVNGDYSPLDALKYVPFGLVGAVIGVRLTEKLNNKMLKKLFALFMLWAGARMIFG
ncbi:MAG: sulfite exporter TauE/SafE family protein [Ruminococcaceae bacterium]|nr:sulfite exporter TauE/SafE family protein [Oscillospiraceae bacterium]MBQ9913379.1 sulfite exporter TauE/SafE family protein [Clostridia bacterium]